MQVMNSGNDLTKPANIKSIVPQGSILGTILLLLFINDLHLYMEQCNSDYYAYDATVHTSGKTNQITTYRKLNKTMGQTKQTCTMKTGKQNKKNMHYENKSCMLLGTRQSTPHSQELDIYIDGNKIKNVTKQKLLGIYIDEDQQ